MKKINIQALCSNLHFFAENAGPIIGVLPFGHGWHLLLLLKTTLRDQDHVRQNRDQGIAKWSWLNGPEIRD